MKKLLIIPVFLLFMSAIPASRVRQSELTAVEPIRVDKLNQKLNEIDSLLKLQQ